MQHQIVGARAGKTDEELRPIGSVGGDGTEQSGAGDVAARNGAAERGADQGVGEVVHAYTMQGDLAARPGPP